MIKWENLGKTDMDLIDKITIRAKKDCVDFVTPQTLNMDLTAVHITSCPLDLNRLLEADKGNFLHDIFGICSHINRETGELLNCFWPRYASKQS